MSEEMQSIDTQKENELSNEARPSIGITLRNARESMNMTIEYAAQQLHLDVRLLKALEAEDFAALPGTTYAYGYLRSYAKILKLPVHDVLQEFQKITDSNTNILIPEHMTFAEKNKVPNYSFRQSLYMVILLVLVLGAIGWVLLGGVLENDRQDYSEINVTEKNSIVISSVSDTTAPVTEAIIEEAIPEPVVIEKKQKDSKPDSEQVKHVEKTLISKPGKSLQLTYQADSWTEVRDATGATLIYRMVSAGENLELEGRAPYAILLGYAPGVSVTYQETNIDTKPYQRDDIAYFKVGQKHSALATEE